MKTITLTTEEAATVRRMMQAYRDNRDAWIDERLWHSGKYHDPEVQFALSEIREANRIIRLLYRKEAESENSGAKNEKEKA